jgi:hypothetical protein
MAKEIILSEETQIQENSNRVDLERIDIEYEENGAIGFCIDETDYP